MKEQQATEDKAAGGHHLPAQHHTRVMEPSEAHLLIIEDNLSNFRLMARLLATHGIRHCVWKTSGSQVLELAESLPRLDLILTDIYLPGEDGFQILKRLRAHPRFAETLIIAVTSEATPENLERARQAGFDGFIGKPINTIRFPAQISQLLRGEAVWELT